jgi:hypothetical protein
MRSMPPTRKYHAEPIPRSRSRDKGPPFFFLHQTTRISDAASIQMRRRREEQLPCGGLRSSSVKDLQVEAFVPANHSDVVGREKDTLRASGVTAIAAATLLARLAAQGISRHESLTIAVHRETHTAHRVRFRPSSADGRVAVRSPGNSSPAATPNDSGKLRRQQTRPVMPPQRTRQRPPVAAPRRLKHTPPWTHKGGSWGPLMPDDSSPADREPRQQ